MTSSGRIGVLLSVCIACHMAAGDTLVTKSGSRYEGKVEDQGDFYLLTKSGGGEMVLPRGMVKEVIKSSLSDMDEEPPAKLAPAKKPPASKRETVPADTKTPQDAEGAWRNDIAAFTRKVSEVARRSRIPDRRQLLKSIRNRTVFKDRHDKPIMVLLQPLIDGELHGELAKTFTGTISWSGKVETIKKDKGGKSYTMEIAWPIPKDLPERTELRDKLLLTVSAKGFGVAGVPKKGDTFAFTGELKKHKPDGGEAVWVYYSLDTRKHMIGASPINVRASVKPAPVGRLSKQPAADAKETTKPRPAAVAPSPSDTSVLQGPKGTPLEKAIADQARKAFAAGHTYYIWRDKDEPVKVSTRNFGFIAIGLNYVTNPARQPVPFSSKITVPFRGSDGKLVGHSVITGKKDAKKRGHTRAGHAAAIFVSGTARFSGTGKILVCLVKDTKGRNADEGTVSNIVAVEAVFE